MRLRIDNWSKRIVCAFAVCVCGTMAVRAQLITWTDPSQIAAYSVGNTQILGAVGDITAAETANAVLINTMAAEFNQIHKWEKKYNNYLKNVSGYASTLKAASSIFTDGVRTFISLFELAKAVASNPEGVIGTISMTNLYLETATEMLTVYTVLKDAIANGSEENMLNGMERSKTLWEIEDSLSSFLKKLNQLVLAVKYYKLIDVWYDLTAGMIDRDNGTIAKAALERWQRMGKVVNEDL